MWPFGKNRQAPGEPPAAASDTEPERLSRAMDDPARATRLVRDDAYEEMGSSYQCIQVAALDAALQEHGVTEAAVRRKVCESFLSTMGSFHDQGWLKPAADAGPVYPLLCFSKRFLNTDTPSDELGEVYAPSEMFSFEEYALGNASLLYEGDPNAEVEIGVFEGE